MPKIKTITKTTSFTDPEYQTTVGVRKMEELLTANELAFINYIGMLSVIRQLLATKQPITNTIMDSLTSIVQLAPELQQDTDLRHNPTAILHVFQKLYRGSESIGQLAIHATTEEETAFWFNFKKYVEVLCNDTIDFYNHMTKHNAILDEVAKLNPKEPPSVLLGQVQRIFAQHSAL